MTQAQINHYRGLWAAARKVLRAQGLSAKECDARRMEIHVQKLGKPVSSLKLTDRQFDLVKGAFLAISASDDLDAQMRAEDGARIRSRHVVATLCSEIGYDDDRLQGMIDQMQREGRLREPDRPRGATEVEAWDIELQRGSVPRLTFDALKVEELETVIKGLRYQVARVKDQRAVEHAAPTFTF